MADEEQPIREPMVPVRNLISGQVGTVALSEYESRKKDFQPLSRDEYRQHKYVASITDDPREKFDAAVNSATASATLGLTDLWAARNLPADEFEKYRLQRQSEIGQTTETVSDIALTVAGGLGGLGKATVGQAVKQGVKAETKALAREAVEETAERVVGSEVAQQAAGAQAKAVTQQTTDDVLAAIAAEAGNSPLGKTLSQRVIDGAGKAVSGTTQTLGATPLGLTSRGAVMLGEAVEAGAARLGAPNLGRVAGMGLEGASEAAVQKVSDNLSEAALGGEDITAERLFAGVGDEALLWGAVGGGLGALGGALGAGKGALDQLIERRKAAQLVPEAATIDDIIRDPDKAGFREGMIDQFIDASAKASGHSPEDIRRILTDKRLQSDFVKRDQVKEQLGERFQKAWDDAHEYAAVERDMLAGSLKTSNVAKTIRRGPEVLASASERMREATKQLLSSSPFLQRQALQAFGATELKGLREMADTAAKRMAVAVESGDEVQAYLALENLKRDLDRKASDAEALIERGGTKSGTGGLQRTRALQQYAEAEAHRVRGFLEDEELWGAAGRNQRMRNEAFVEMYRPARDTRARFTTKLREGAESLPFADNTYGSRKIEYADRSKIDSYLASLSDPGRDVVHNQTIRYFDGREKFLRTVLESGEVPEELAEQFQKSLEATQAARAAVREASERISGVNLLEEMLKREERDATKEFGPLTSIGIGLATGGIRGGIAESANVLTGRALAKPASIANKLAVVGSMSERVAAVDRKINTRVRDIAAKAAEGLGRAAIAGGRALKSASRGVRAGAPAAYHHFGNDPEARREKVEKRLDRILDMHANPVLSLRHAGEITRGMSQSAPAVTAAAARKHMTALDYIASKAKPSIELNASLLQPHLTKRGYTDQQIRELAQILTVVERPLTLLDDLENGQISQVQVDAMKAVWPELFKDIRLKLTMEFGKTAKPLPYSSVVQLSLLFDIPGHPTLDPAFIQRQQERYAAEDEQKQQAQPPPPPNSTERMAMVESSMNLADRVARSL